MSEITELLLMMKNDPDAVLRALQENPDLVALIQNNDELHAMAAGGRPSVDSFRVIYKEFFDGRELPYVAEGAAEEFLWALKYRKGVMLEGWRGFGKSTFFTAWGPTVMGWRPVGSTVLTRINDQKAKEMGKAIAFLIQTNPGWKKVFPNVVPDERAGWSVENGFNVMDLNVTGKPGSKDFETNYARWRMMCLADHLSEQSLLCAGIESGSIIGTHSSNGSWFDDLHNKQNTRSQAELKKVTDIVEYDIIPTWFGAGGSPTLGVFCTPWSKNPPDAYQIMLRTGLFKHVKIPIFKEDPEGEEIPAENKDGVPAAPEWVGKKVRLAWPERFPMDEVINMMNSMKTGFGQMALLDIELSKPKNMKYQEFPDQDIKWDQWPLTDGVDPVGTVEGVSQGDGISHFALAHLLHSPYNTLIIGDGIVEKCDAFAGEDHVMESRRTYSKTHRGTSIESNGIGAIFIGNVTRNRGFKPHAHGVSELGEGSKKQRQYQFLQPLFASGSLLVSDADTPFLNAVREYCDNFPNFDKDSYLWDVGDALAIGVLDVPQIWTRVVTRSAEKSSIWNEPKSGLGSVWNSLGA